MTFKEFLELSVLVFKQSSHFCGYCFSFSSFNQHPHLREANNMHTKNMRLLLLGKKGDDGSDNGTSGDEGNSLDDVKLLLSQLRRTRLRAGGVRLLRAELLHGNTDTLAHGLLGLATPDTGIVKLLVGLVGASGVADLSLEVVVLLLLKGTETVPVGPLGVGINVHLDHAGLDGGLDLLIGGSGSTVHDEVDGLVVLAANLLLSVGLVLEEPLGAKDDVAGLVDAVDVAEGGSDREHGSDLGQGLVDGVDLLGAGVELLGVHILVVDAVLLAAGDADLHLEPDLHGGHALEVLDADGNVLLVGLLAEVEHVGGEEGLAVLGVELLVGLEHAVEPGEELLGAVVRVEDDGDAVVLGNGTDVHGKGDGTGDGGVGLLDGLADHEGTSSVGDLDHDGTVVLLGGLEAGVDGRGRGAVDGGCGWWAGTVRRNLARVRARVEHWIKCGVI